VDGVIEDNGGTWSLYGAGNVFAHVGAYAAELAGALVVMEYIAAQGGYQVSSHAAEKMAERKFFPSMIRWTISDGARASNLVRNGGVGTNLWRFLTTTRHVLPATQNSTSGALTVVRNIWTNNIITVIFKS